MFSAKVPGKSRESDLPQAWQTRGPAIAMVVAMLALGISSWTTGMKIADEALRDLSFGIAAVAGTALAVYVAVIVRLVDSYHAALKDLRQDARAWGTKMYDLVRSGDAIVGYLADVNERIAALEVAVRMSGVEDLEDILTEDGLDKRIAGITQTTQGFDRVLFLERASETKREPPTHGVSNDYLQLHLVLSEILSNLANVVVRATWARQQMGLARRGVEVAWALGLAAGLALISALAASSTLPSSTTEGIADQWNVFVAGMLVSATVWGIASVVSGVRGVLSMPGGISQAPPEPSVVGDGAVVQAIAAGFADSGPQVRRGSVTRRRRRRRFGAAASALRRRGANSLKCRQAVRRRRRALRRSR